MPLWRVMLAIWLIVSGIIWMIGPTFPYAFPIEGLVAIVAAVFVLVEARAKP